MLTTCASPNHEVPGHGCTFRFWHHTLRSHHRLAVVPGCALLRGQLLDCCQALPDTEWQTRDSFPLDAQTIYVDPTKAPRPCPTRRFVLSISKALSAKGGLSECDNRHCPRLRCKRV